MNAMIKMANPPNKLKIKLESQSYFCPPSSKANIKQITAPTKVIAPNQSIFAFYERVILYKRM